MRLLRLLPLPQYFNSIKVRLEPSVAGGTIWKREFQFHKGAIRTINFILSQRTCHIFQFHKGAIRTNSRIFSRL